MNKLVHLKMTKQFLRKVVNYRRNLQKFGHGKPVTENMVKAMSAIPYNVSHIDSFDRMMGYIGQKQVQQQVIELIPSNKAAWKAELQHLILEGNILEGKYVRQTELEF